MSNKLVVNSKAVSIQSSAVMDVAAQGVARALNARKMAELSSQQDLDNVGGGIALSSPITIGLIVLRVPIILGGFISPIKEIL